MPFPNFHAARIEDPEQFASIKMLKQLPNGIQIYGGKTGDDENTKAQTYRFPKSKFTVAQSKKWLKDHDIKTIRFEPAKEQNMDRLRKLLKKEEVVRREREKRVDLITLPNECGELKPLKIKQGFLREVRKDNQPYCDLRIREVDGKKYSMTMKFRPDNQEAETAITKEMFQTMWPAARSKQEKERYIMDKWIVDRFKDGRVVAEFEYTDGNTAAHLPKGFQKA